MHLRSAALLMLFALDLASAPVATAADAAATGQDHTYLGVGWYGIRGDGFSNERGVGVQGSWMLDDRWILSADHRFSDGRRSDLSQSRFGIGYRVELDGRSDAILRVGFARSELDGLVNRSDHAAFVEVLARLAISQRIDLVLGMRHAKLDGLSDLNLLAEVEWHFGAWSLAAEIASSGDGESLLIGPRYRFR